MPLTTPTELALFLMRPLTTAEDAAAELLIELATGIIRSEAGQYLTFVADDEVLLEGGYAGELELPEWPVVDVTAVGIEGTTLDAAAYRWDERRLIRRYGLPSVNIGEGPGDSTSGYWGGRGATIAVTYSHGYADDAIPSDLKLLALSMVKRALLNPTEVKQESLGAHSATFMADAAGVFLDGDEVRIARRYRKRSATVGNASR